MEFWRGLRPRRFRRSVANKGEGMRALSREGLLRLLLRLALAAAATSGLIVTARAAASTPELKRYHRDARATARMAPSTVGVSAAASSPGRALDQNNGLAGTERYDVGLYVHYCPAGRRQRTSPEAGPESSGGESPAEATAGESPGYESKATAKGAGTSEAGWPAKECLKMDKGPAGRKHTLVGLNGVHNWLLGGYGNDTIIGGNHGDVIWSDYQPSGEPRSQTATIHAGNGRNVIYANDTHNYVWTGSNPYTVVHAHVSGISGVIHCQSPWIVVYLSTVSEHRFTLDGCHHISHYSVGY